MEELKRLIEQMGRDFEEFKKAHESEIKKLKEQNHAPADIIEKVDRINTALDEKGKKIEELETAMNRPAAGTEGGKKDVDHEKMNAMYKSAFRKHCAGKSLNKDEQEAYEYFKTKWEEKGLSVDQDAQGGFFVEPERASTINSKVFESSPMRQLATVITISSDRWQEWADFDEPAANWVGEKESRSETDNSEVKLLEIPVHELHAQPRITQKLLEDGGIDVDAWHQGKVVDKFARAEENAFFQGDGVVKPHGILKYASGQGFNKVEQVETAASATIAADDLIDVQNALFEAFQMNARWLMQRQTAQALRKLKNADGSYLWSFDGAINEGPKETLLGKQVRFATDMDSDAGGNLAIAYGDFRQFYYIIDRRGIRVLRDPYSAKPNVILDTTKRVGGGVRQFQAAKLLKVKA